ncbi:cupin domain-containing protein, partial [Bacillus licheniformis]|nr:cupin domain-containing protein [Bacillus licheniformis]
MADADLERKSWDQPEGASFNDWMEGRVARYATRRYDWDALKFQADYDPKYRRAQMRYVGTGGTGVAKDVNTV